MQTFLEWLRVVEQRQELVPQAVLDGYERGFREALKKLLGRVQDPALRGQNFASMLDCPIQDAQGQVPHFHRLHRLRPWCAIKFTVSPTSKKR